MEDPDGFLHLCAVCQQFPAYTIGDLLEEDTEIVLRLMDLTAAAAKEAKRPDG